MNKRKILFLLLQLLSAYSSFKSIFASEGAFEAKVFTNPGNLSLAKGKARSVSTFLSNLFNQEPRNTPDWIILDI